MLKEQIKRILYLFLNEKEQSNFKKNRKYSKSYCTSTACKNMGFSQKASCRPYKNCYN